MLEIYMPKQSGGFGCYGCILFVWQPGRSYSARLTAGKDTVGVGKTEGWDSVSLRQTETQEPWVLGPDIQREHEAAQVQGICEVSWQRVYAKPSASTLPSTRFCKIDRISQVAISSWQAMDKYKNSLNKVASSTFFYYLKTHFKCYFHGCKP